jgi:hypothetical protein
LSGFSQLFTRGNRWLLSDRFHLLYRITLSRDSLV